MKRFFAIICVIACPFLLSAQNFKFVDGVKDTALVVYNGNDSSEMKVALSPVLEGGYAIVIKTFNKNLRYPDEAIDNDIQGVVWIAFVVNTDGTASGFWIKKGKHPALDKEALRAVKLIPHKWTPATIDGKPVKVSFSLPVIYKLEG